jgi:hypothetical protein
MSKIKEIEKIAEKLASDQLTAYNNRDIDNFLIPFSDSVEVYMFPNELLFKGKEEMRKRYKTMFENTPELHCKLTNRTVMGKVVIDAEEVSGKLENELVRAVAIYTIKNQKIQKVHFIKPSL